MKKGFDEMECELNENGVDSEVAQTLTSRPRHSIQVPDEIDSLRSTNQITSNNLGLAEPVSINEKPGLKNPSKMTDLYYDFTNAKRGVALIFNHKTFNGRDEVRHGTEKDGVDLINVLEGLQFDVRSYMDLKLDDIEKVLYDVSKEDHSDNDCLWVTVMTHGKENGKISSADDDYNVQELWENFLGKKCKSLIGKPKLFFIQACRGEMVDRGVFLLQPNQMVSDAVDTNSLEFYNVIPKLPDYLVMFSSSASYYSFRDTKNGSWFIQALCEELKTNPENDFICILTAVNRRVHAKQSNVSENTHLNDAKQASMFQSTLTKILCLTVTPKNK